MQTVDFVKKIIPQVLEYYNLPPVTGRNHYKGECPICGKRGKFRIDNKNNSGSWICVCGSGNIWKLLIESTGKDFKTLAGEIDQLFGNSYHHEPRQERVRHSPLDRYSSAIPIHESSVKDYLAARGIFEIPKRAVKCSNGNMYAIAADEKGSPIYSHETFLTGSKKADVEIGKKMISISSNAEFAQSVAIRMFEQQSTLGIAEGIETALSCRQIYKCAMWSTLNSPLMKKFRAPAGVCHLMIFADNDNNGTGLAAAFECGNRNILHKNDVKKVTIRWPMHVEDFNDMLREGSQVCEWTLNAK